MQNIILSIILSLILAIIAFLKKALTNSALILAFIFSIIICYFGKINSYIILVLVFLGSVISHKLSSKKIDETKNIIEKHKEKDIYQIIANVGTGTFFIIVYAITKNIFFLVIYASVMAESLSDSLASDIGVLSKKPPINIRTLKRDTRGLSGNVSLLGLISSLIGSIIIGITFYISYSNIIYLMIIIISSFIGAIFDSFLGAFFQKKYRCPKCGITTELKKHCNTITIKTSKHKFLNNDMVNLLSNIATALLSLLLLILFNLK